ncbi:MAG TPA: cation:proton antiporter [Candidatus Limnocylindrales bacterium]|jgi:CPA2 family monovalent cation:H+ antiporter-2
MDHEPVLISTIAIGLTAAFIGGFVARRVGLPAIVGYIVAGVAIGPFTPGLVADPSVATELAEIGVILLMFGVGIHFSFRDLLAVRWIAIPGAAIQIAIATILGTWLGIVLGYGVGGGLVIGLAISVASTVVLLRALEDRNELDTEQGRIAVGWLIVEDIFTVIVLVLLPLIAPILGARPPETGVTVSGSLAEGGGLAEIALAIGRAAIFAIVMVVAGARLIPWLLLQVARQGSRELFTLSVLAIALGIAYAASTIFGVSFALGAFLAGLVVSESDMSHQAAADALPLRDAFAVLFFVSVGMLLDPTYLIANPLPVLAIVALIVLAQPAAAFLIVVLFGYPTRVALTVASALGQIGEFSFILGTLGLALGLLPEEGFQLVVAGALLSIAINPVLFALIEPLERRLRNQPLLLAMNRRRIGELASIGEAQRASLVNHAIICGYGRVGRLIGPALERRGFKYAVITQQRDEVDRLRSAGVIAIYGDAAQAEVLEMAGVQSARLVVVATSEPNETRLIVERIHELDSGVDIVVRTHSDREAARLRALGGKVQAVHGERELAVQMARYALRRFGLSSAEAEAIAQGLRGRAVVGPAEAGPRPLAGAVERLRERISGRRA